MTGFTSARSEFLKAFRPSQLMPGLTAGLVNGIIILMVTISFGALIFANIDPRFVSLGIGLALFNALLVGLIAAFFSLFPGAVALGQDSPVAILALIASAIASASGLSPQTKFYTVVAILAISTALVGLTFLLLGMFKLGSLVRYVPYPVIGGFLAGTGLLLVKGSIGLMSGLDLTGANLPALFSNGALLRWLPGLLFGVIMFVTMRRFSHFLILPGMLVGGVALFFLILSLAGVSIADAQSRGLLIGSGADNIQWQWITLDALRSADWAAVLGRSGSVGAVIVVSVVSFLLNATGLEVAAQEDLDLNHELRLLGVANLLCGAVSGIPGYHTLSLTALARRMGATTWLGSFVSAGIVGVALLWGGKILQFVPTAALGGLLMFLGLGFLIEWLYDAYRRLPKPEYAVILAIVVVIGAVGYLEGVAVGLALMIILFIVNYSRTNVVKETYTGQTYLSYVERPRLYQQLIQSKGHWLYILKLQGYMFFGSADSLISRIRDRLALGEASPKFIILDFQLVSGIDSSALVSIARMKQITDKAGIALAFTRLSPHLNTMISREVCSDSQDAGCRIFETLDFAIEWAENEIIETFNSVGLLAKPKTIIRQIEELFPDKATRASFQSHLEEKSFAAGETLIQQGQHFEGITFIESGEVSVWIDLDGGHSQRIRKMTGGTVVGEISLYLRQDATASVRADTPTHVYFLSASSLADMALHNPMIAATFHQFMAQILAERANDLPQRTLLISS